MVELFVVQPYRSTEHRFEPEMPVQCTTLDSAIRRAEELCETYDGAAILSVMFDPVTFFYGSYKVLQKFGKVPEDPLGVL